MIINGELVKTRRRYLTANGIIKAAKHNTGHDISKYRVYGMSKHAGRMHITNKHTVCTDDYTEFAIVYDP